MRALWFVSLVACTVPEIEYVPLVRELAAELPVTPNRDLDILLVVDNSTTMTEKQVALAANLPVLLNRLNLVEGGLPNLHLGVVTTDMGTKASADASPGPTLSGCAGTGDNGKLQVNGAPVTGAFLSDIKQANGSRVVNYTGSLADAAGAMIRLGSAGCGFEQPLAAMKAALNSNPNNAGFLRPQARLAVIFLGDEDDCSAKHTALYNPTSTELGPLDSFRCTRHGVTCEDGGADPAQMGELGTKSGCHAATDSEYLDDVAPFRAFLAGLKDDPRDVMVATLAGKLEPFVVEQGPMGDPALQLSCTGTQSAVPPVRLQSFLDLFPERARTGSLCQANPSAELDAIGGLALRTIGSPCLTRAPTDTDGVTVGLQEDCTVEEVVDTTSVGFFPKCGAPPCWSLTVDAAACPADDHLKLVVDRGGVSPPPKSVARLRCRVDGN